MGTVFAAVVEAFTKIVLDVLGLIVQVEGLSETTVVGINVGNFLTALLTFVLTAVGAVFRGRRALQPAERDRARTTSRRRPPRPRTCWPRSATCCARGA